jgi:hypothetical protein
MGRPKGFKDTKSDPDARCHGKQYRYRPSISKQIDEIAERFEVSPADLLEHIFTESVKTGFWETVDITDPSQTHASSEEGEEGGDEIELDSEELAIERIRSDLSSDWLEEYQKDSVARRMFKTGCSELDALDHFQIIDPEEGVSYKTSKIQEIVFNLKKGYLYTFKQRVSIAVNMYEENLTEEQAIKGLINTGYLKKAAKPMHSKAFGTAVKTANKKRHKVSR